jgi:hypothetical protein
MNKNTITIRCCAKELFLVAMALLILPTFLARANDYEVKGRAGDYNIVVRMDKNPPARGYNNMDVAITDGSAKPVTDAKVHVEYLMPSLPGRPPMMEYSATVKPSGHHYSAQLDLSMSGKWTVVLKVTRAGKTDTMEFSFVAR